MAQVTVSINGRDYPITCGDGEEARTRALAHEVDRRVKGLVADLGQVGEARLLVLALLTLADELADSKANAGNGHAPDSIATGIDALASRIETVAVRLESAKI
jgi:cell division protein ZapA